MVQAPAFVILCRFWDKVFCWNSGVSKNDLLCQVQVVKGKFCSCRGDAVLGIIGISSVQAHYPGKFDFGGGIP